MPGKYWKITRLPSKRSRAPEAGGPAFVHHSRLRFKIRNIGARRAASRRPRARRRIVSITYPSSAARPRDSSRRDLSAAE
jgi:hypothetical protein